MGIRQIIKALIRGGIRVALWPWRRKYSRRNGVTSQEQRIEIPNDILLTAVRDAIREGHTATILVKGWSMRPFLEHQRDRVLLDAPTDIAVGDAVLAEIGPGHFVLHRIWSMDGDDVTLMGDGNLQGQEHCHRKDICGIVTQYIRPRRMIPASDPKLVRDIRLWRRLLPYRRYLLLFYKALV